MMACVFLALPNLDMDRYIYLFACAKESQKHAKCTKLKQVWKLTSEVFSNFTAMTKAIQYSANQGNTGCFIMVWARLWQRRSCKILTATDIFRSLKEVWFAFPFEKKNWMLFKLRKNTAAFRASCSSPQSRQAATRQLKMSHKSSIKQPLCPSQFLQRWHQQDFSNTDSTAFCKCTRIESKCWTAATKKWSRCDLRQ